MDEYNSFRNCVIREKKIFKSKSGMTEEQLKADPMAIPNYLEQHFKEKEKMKKQRQMMGENDPENLMKTKLQKMEEEGMIRKKKIDLEEFQQKRKQEETYI
mmetsp:Transcript_2887/g.2714  ORF Transcript_2887/g.2714 Transcript_2887/m.2714 type:complete len:101 (-) Transcript_2887:21-323(-)